MTDVITVGNFKGGVGKTTTSVMLSFLLNIQHKKTLIIDFDPQANATEVLSKTYNFSLDEKVDSMEGIKNGNLSESIIHASDYLDIIPSTWNLSLFPTFLDNFEKSKQDYVLRELLKPIKEKYKYIIIDTPPTLSHFTNNAILASDYVLMVLQSQQQCFTSTIRFGAYVQGLHNDYDKHIDVIGIVPYLVKKRGPIDAQVITDAAKAFGKLLFRNTIYTRERIKRYGREGIKAKPGENYDFHDKEVLDMYGHVLKELESKIKTDKRKKANNE